MALEHELLAANARGVAPPQNWTTRAAKELMALRKDAERYRWLRQDETAADWWDARIVELHYGDYSRKTGESLDVAVDAAMKGRAVDA
jgi:hypothetical protein